MPRFTLPSFSSRSPTQNDKFALSFSPLAALDGASFPTIQAGIEYKINPVFSWYNEFGVEYARGSYDPRDSSIFHPHGIKAKTELRYYFHGKPGKTGFFQKGHYLAANAFLTSDAHNTKFDYLSNYAYNGDSSVRKTDAIGVKKWVWGFNVLYGWEMPIAKRWGWGCYLGLGVRFRYITHSHMEFTDKDRLINSVDLNVLSERIRADVRGGFTSLPNITAGIHIFYRL